MLATLRQRNFALLWFGGLISQTGDWLLGIGLTVYVYLLTGSALATSIVLIVEFVPGTVLSSLAGVFVDRWDRRWTMIISNLLLAAGLLPLLAVHDKSSLWIVYGVQFFEASAAQFVLPAEGALLPHVVSEEQLVTANALKSIGQNTARLAGAALGGLIVGLLGLRSVILLDTASFLFASLTLWLMRVPMRSRMIQPATENEGETGSAVPGTSSLKRLGREWLEGMQLIYQQRPLLILFIMIAIQSVGEGIFSVLLVVFVRKVLGGGAVAYGSLLSVQAVGSLIGGVIIGQLGNRVPAARLIGVGALLFGIIDLLIIDIPIFVPSLLLVGLLFILVGIPGTGMVVGLNALFQSIVEDTLRGRIFGAFFSVQALLVLTGMILAGLLGDRLGSVLMLNIQGGGYVLSGLLAILTLGGAIASQQVSKEGELVGQK